VSVLRFHCKIATSSRAVLVL